MQSCFLFLVMVVVNRLNTIDVIASASSEYQNREPRWLFSSPEIYMVSRVNRKINHQWLHNGSELIFFDCVTNKTLLFYNVKEMKRCKLFCLEL